MALTPYSWKIVTTANCSFAMPFECPPVGIWNDALTPKTATIEGAAAATLPNDDEIWVEVEYLGSGASPQASFVSDCKADMLAIAAAQTASSAVWGGGFATFNGTPDAGVVVSGDGLTVTHGSISNARGVMSLSFRNTGKYYFEIKANTLGGAANIGVMPAGKTSTITDFVLFGTEVATDTLGEIASNGASLGKYVGAWVDGDVYCAALDLTARLGWFRRNNGNWNGDVTANPTTGTGGVIIAPGTALAPAVRFSTGGATGNFVGNFGQAAFVQTPPAGFGNWSAVLPFKLSTTFTAAQPGFVYARVKCAKPSATFYVDPMVVLS